MRNINVQKLRSWGYFDCPASLAHHLAIPGGLLIHCANVAQVLAKAPVAWDRADSPLVIGFLHDLCKTDDYVPAGPDRPGLWLRNPNAKPGHGGKSADMARSIMPDLTIQEELCIRYHMGAFTDKEEWKNYTNAIHNCEAVLWTHHADMVATHVMEVGQ